MIWGFIGNICLTRAITFHKKHSHETRMHNDSNFCDFLPYLVQKQRNCEKSRDHHNCINTTSARPALRMLVFRCNEWGEGAELWKSWKKWTQNRNSGPAMPKKEVLRLKTGKGCVSWPFSAFLVSQTVPKYRDMLRSSAILRFVETAFTRPRVTVVLFYMLLFGMILWLNFELVLFVFVGSRVTFWLKNEHSKVWFGLFSFFFVEQDTPE